MRQSQDSSVGYSAKEGEEWLVFWYLLSLVFSCGTLAKFLPLLFSPSPLNSEVLLLPLGFTVFLSRSCASKSLYIMVTFLFYYFMHMFTYLPCLVYQEAPSFFNKVIALINYFIGHIIQCVGSSSLTRGQTCNHWTARVVLETPSFYILVFFRFRVHSPFWRWLRSILGPSLSPWFLPTISWPAFSCHKTLKQDKQRTDCSLEFTLLHLYSSVMLWDNHSLSSSLRGGSFFKSFYFSVVFEEKVLEDRDQHSNCCLQLFWNYRNILSTNSVEILSSKESKIKKKNKKP